MLFRSRVSNYYYLAVLGLCCCAGFSLAAASGGYTPVAVSWLLIAVASLLVERGLQGMPASVLVAPAPWSTGPGVVVRRPDCSTACGTFLALGVTLERNRRVGDFWGLHERSQVPFRTSGQNLGLPLIPLRHTQWGPERPLPTPQYP